MLKSIGHWLWMKLKLTVNRNKSAVDRPWKRSFLGFTFSQRGKAKRLKVSDKSLKLFKDKIKRITKRTRGRTVTHIVMGLRQYLLGWRAYFGIAEVKSPLKMLDKLIRRKLRCYIWKQWGRSGYRQLRKRGVDRQLAWNTSKSAHGPWRLSHSPALYLALPIKYFRKLGLPGLVIC